MLSPVVEVEEDEEAAPDPREAFFFPEEGPDDPRPMMAQLVEECEEFHELHRGEATIMTVMRAEPKAKNGRSILGEMALPRFQGSTGAFAMWLLAMSTNGIIPDFIMTLDAAWWAGATGHQRAGLIHHELMHAEHAKDKEGEPKFTETGQPIWAIRGHHIEEFRETVERYGDFAGDVTPFVLAAARGGIKAND